MTYFQYLLAATTFLCLASCDADTKAVVEAAIGDQATAEAPIKSLDQVYWYDGKAEVSTYDLRQNRYNDIHNGEVVAIFVTEDFLTDKQVKNDNYTSKNSISVLKTNLIRRFTTGLYDYSMMTSVFTRADGSSTEKITMSSQDWCGQSYVQVNKKGVKYNLQMRSYFESEGDVNATFKADLLEDELMNLLRIDPKLIPTGSVDILPSLTALRLTHKDHSAYQATITNAAYTADEMEGPDLRILTVDYQNYDRKVEIIYESSSPHKIAGWRETSPSVFDKKDRTTIVTRRAMIHEPYWKMNQSSDLSRRAPMGLAEYK